MSHDSFEGKSILGHVRDLTQNRVQVLCFLACEGPANIYQIAKGIGIAYSVAHNSVKDLENQGFIKLEQKKLGQKGVMTKIYGLTLKGLLMAIKNEEFNPEDIDNIAQHCKELLPLIFGNWKYLAEMGLKNEVLRFLKTIDIDYDERKVMFYLAVEGIGMQGLYDFIFSGGTTGGYGYYGSKEYWESLAKWLKAIRGHPELKKWMIEHIKREVNIAKALLKISEETLQLIESPSKSKWEKFKKAPVVDLLKGPLTSM